MRARVYPRASGGTLASGGYSEPTPGQTRGLSPRERGNHGVPCHSEPRLNGVGSIPARAGEPGRRPSAGQAWAAVYPRASGGTIAPLKYRSSPHRSIPARAGEPPRARPEAPSDVVSGLSPRERGNPEAQIDARPRIPEVYPRASGGTTRLTARTRPWAGSIPARAGEPQLASHPRHPALGSIPARAGEPGMRAPF